MGSGSSVESHLLPLQLVEVSIQYEEANQLFCMKYDDDDNRELSLFGQLVLLSFGHPDELTCVSSFRSVLNLDLVLMLLYVFVPFSSQNCHAGSKHHWVCSGACSLDLN